MEYIPEKRSVEYGLWNIYRKSGPWNTVYEIKTGKAARGIQIMKYILEKRSVEYSL